MQRILAVDTSAMRGSVALAIGGDVLVEYTNEPRAHTRELEPMMNRLLRQAGVGLRDLDALAFGQGPGSFTGLRITAGFVQGLAWGLDCPVVPISTLAALAASVPADSGPVSVAASLDARMGEIYWGCYRVEGGGDIAAIVDDRLIAPESAALPPASGEEWFGAGTGWLYRAAMPAQVSGAMKEIREEAMPDAACIARLAIPELAKGRFVQARDVQPVYIRDDVGWQKTASR